MLTRAFGISEQAFGLRLEQWRDLEKSRDCGLGVIAARLAPLVALKAGGLGTTGLMAAAAGGQLGSARLDDVRDPILFGLIGGGLTSTEAGGLVRNVFDEAVNKGRGPLLEWCDLALQIVLEAIVGLPDEPEIVASGEPKAAAKSARRSKTAKPGSPSSMAP